MQLSIINKTHKIFFLLFLLNSPIFSQTYKIVDTGQITFYDDGNIISSPNIAEPFYGQDAQYTANQPSYTNNLNGTITDNVTGLIWQQDMGEKITFENAFIKADSLSLASYSDWRVPTLKELYSLIQFTGQVSGATAISMFIDTNYFFQPLGNTNIGEREIDAQTWSSTEYVGRTMNNDETVFGVNFVDGRIKGYPKYKPITGSANTMYFRMVRGNAEYGKNSFVNNGDNTISDFATGLMWQKADDGNARDWEESLSYAKNSEFAEYDDWRLPNAKELQSIVDYTRSPQTTNSPAINPIFETTEINDPEGNSGQYPFFWTSTTHLDGVNPYSGAAYIAFGEGQGEMNGNLMDVHGAGCQRSDPKSGNIEDYPQYFGPQGDVRYVYNYVRLVRDAELDTTFEDIGKSEGGHTLFAPLGKTTTYLIDENGDVFNSWETEFAPALSAYLLNDKSLLRTSSLGRNGNIIFNGSGGAGEKVERYNWEGNIIWEFLYSSDQYLLHHDIEYLPNGNILMIAWEYKTESEAIEAGRNPSILTDGELWPDKIIEVEPAGDSGGNIVWEWHVWDHLVQDFDISKSNYGSIEDSPGKININFESNGGADWNHTNAIDYNEEHDQILITVKNFSEIWIIDHNTTTEEAASSSGDLLYRWGNPQTYNRGTSSDQKLFGPHDGQWIEKEYPGGNDVLIFNNGKDREDGSYSSVDQISLPINTNGDYSISNDSTFEPTELTWTYQRSNFFADHISGAQRLPGGNTLICKGTEGKFFEVTKDGAIVWEYINPFLFTNPQGASNNEVFRAYRYNLDELDSDDPTNIIQSHSDIPTEFELQQNYPNPFNPSTIITVSIPENGNYTLKVYNILGQEVATLLSAQVNAGTHTFNFDASNLTSGIYFYNFSGNDFTQKKKMMLMK